MMTAQEQLRETVEAHVRSMPALRNAVISVQEGIPPFARDAVASMLWQAFIAAYLNGVTVGIAVGKEARE